MIAGHLRVKVTYLKQSLLAWLCMCVCVCVWLHGTGMVQVRELDLIRVTVCSIRELGIWMCISHSWLWNLSGEKKKVKMRWAKDNEKVVGTMNYKSQLNCWSQIFTGSELEWQKIVVTERDAGTWDHREDEVCVMIKSMKWAWHWMAKAKWRTRSLEDRQ